MSYTIRYNDSLRGMIEIQAVDGKAVLSIASMLELNRIRFKVGNGFQTITPIYMGAGDFQYWLDEDTPIIAEAEKEPVFDNVVSFNSKQ